MSMKLEKLKTREMGMTLSEA